MVIIFRGLGGVAAAIIGGVAAPVSGIVAFVFGVSLLKSLAVTAAFGPTFAAIVSIARAIGIGGVVAGTIGGEEAVAVGGIVAVAAVVLAAVVPAPVIVEAGTTPVTVPVAIVGAGTLLGVWIGWRAFEGDEKYTFVRYSAIVLTATKGTSFRDADLTDADFTGAILKSTDLKSAILIRTCWQNTEKLNFVNPGNSYLNNAQVRELVRTSKGGGKNFNRLDLRGINLKGADLKDADFTGTDLSRANLQDTNLSNAKLTQTLLEGADLTQATLTGACIEDWIISSNTKLSQVNCDYIYFRSDKQERRPASGNFAPGEFATLVEKYIETVDLIFREGIDWKAFLTSFQDLRVEYGEENVSIQAIEKKSDGAFVIRLSVPPDVDKAEIESKAKQSYETQLQVLEAQYRAELQAKDTEINIYKQQSANMMEIVKLQASRPINVEAKAVSGERNINTGEYRETNLHDNSRYVETRDSSTYYENYNSPQEKTLAEAADEIQKLLQQLEKTNPTATEAEKVAYVNDETTPSFKRRVVGALKAGGETAIEEFLDNPYVNVGKAAIMGWMDA
ncbi:MAG: pentapeptide repeat-containing protein [Pleurocapsa sp. MO_226.B13]|nr:pentapeptide repeat-containing protein [Pleurocapsa sp. MO_226.B13]